MSLRDSIREHTREISDALAQLERRRTDATSEVAAAENRLRQVSMEARSLRSREDGRKRALGELDAKLQGLQHEIDELERQRLELVDRLLERQQERQTSDALLREIHGSIEKVEKQIRSAREDVEAKGRELRKVEEDRERYRSKLGESYRSALVTSLDEQRRRIAAMFASEEERRKKQAIVEQFKRARHEDSRLAELCEQREQYLQFVGQATVPGVKATLEREMSKIEEQIEDVYPGALHGLEDPAITTSEEDLYYYADESGDVALLVPVDKATWDAFAAGSQVEPCYEAAWLLWNLVKELKLKPSDGQFASSDFGCVFRSNLGMDLVPALGGFACKLGVGSVYFNLVAMPNEMQEVMSNEAAAF